MDALGAATLLSRLGISATEVYWLTSAGLWAYEVGMFLQLGGWAAVGGLVGLGKPYGGRSPEVFRRLIESHPRGAFKTDDEWLQLIEQMYNYPEGSYRGATLAPDVNRIIEVIARSDYNYADLGHEHVHFQQYLGIGASPYNKPAAELEACMWELRTAAQVGDYQWFRQAWMKVQHWLQVLGSQ
jgi:hypothetical protein